VADCAAIVAGHARHLHDKGEEQLIVAGALWFVLKNGAAAG